MVYYVQFYQNHKKFILHKNLIQHMIYTLDQQLFHKYIQTMMKY